eukprot:CAMPEP_0198231322 /NCGR_PEP_ID=MMETSP1445-20131203/115142_1 /TAXON_ID=36898 /ORGANISM="Pyramimonas sp., Strain CCMP2087" /LENGTH=618 /DNA_ID=CAMNT_0043911931 /DNA_START=53 /DNA_END=1909 /DNA_ORIENTATION=+
MSTICASTICAPVAGRIGSANRQQAARVLSPAQFARAASSNSATLSSKASVQPLFASRNARRATVRALAKHVVAEATGKTEVKKAEKPMNIVFVSTEVSPWSKTGGLGDVVGSLPEELVKRGHKVMSVSPRYDQYKGAWDTSVSTNVIGEDIRFFHEKKKGVDRVFVDSPLFLAKVFGKTGSKLYGEKSGADFEDNAKRFAVLNYAAFEAQKLLPFGFGEDVVFVANDWHSGLTPVLLKTVYQPKGEFKNAKCAFVVHNIAFQGRFWAEDGALEALGLPKEAHAAFKFEDGYDIVFSEHTPADEDEVKPKKLGQTFDKFNWLQAGFTYADKNLTVSPNYAEEIMSGPAKGVEMDTVLAKLGGIEGILNGMDPAEWNPAKDKYLDMPYDKDTVIEGKAAAKAALQAEAGLPVDPKAPLFGYIGRLEEQKGVDIMLAAVKKLPKTAQVVILGTGKKKYETALKALKGNSVGVAKFSAPLAHMINAGADFLLVPSRFEPCGLIQLHAMVYGTVPIVASTGGLVDTVKEGVTGFHMGMMDADDLVEEDVTSMVSTMKRACEVYATPAYPKMVKACIGQDLTWKLPAQKWEGVLEELMFGAAESSQTKKSTVASPKDTVKAQA